MPAEAQAHISVWEGGCLWIGRTLAPFEGDPHAHHALQVSLLLDGEWELSSDAATSNAKAVLVDADIPHRIDVHGTVAFLFVDPESRAGRALRARNQGSPTPALLDDPDVEATRQELIALWADGASSDRLRDAGRGLLDRLAGATPARLPDPRVARMIEAIGERLDERIDFASASEAVHLSPSRLRHLFAEEVGLPFKSYVLWRRLMRAVDSVGRGETLTSAAHGAGFADSAHFSRTFRRAFGLNASALERL